MPANSTPLHKTGRVAATALPTYCPIKNDGSAAGAGDPILGITEASANAGSRVSVIVNGSAEAWAGEAIADGAVLQVGANNTVVKAAGGAPIGRALNAASAGDKVEVLLSVAVSIEPPTNAFGYSMISDSRSYDLTIGSGLNSRNWFNWACAYYKQTPVLVGNYGAPGKRSDEYLTNGNFETAMADSSKWLIFGYPAANDITQATATPYTDTFGRSVTVSNVAQYVCDNLITYAKRAVGAGKSVILLTEPGTTTCTAAQVGAVHELNRLLKMRISEVPGAILYDPCPLLWNPTSSTTLLAFRANYSGDGVHAQQAAARAVGADFAANVLPSIIPKIDTAPANLSDSLNNGTNQLYRNPLFNTLTGGTNGGNLTLSSGTIPANMTISGSAAAGLAVTITSAANANGFGNDVTLALSSTSAVSTRIDLTIANADWSLTDLFEGWIELDIAAGGTNVSGVYAQMYVQTNAGTADWWANYAGNSGPMSTSGETGLVLRTRKGGAISGSVTKSGVQLRIYVVFSAAGSQTITLRRPGIYRYVP